jgi:hypothetical protein
LQKGQWQGRQLISSAWVQQATSLQTANGSDPTSDWNQGYGFQFWRCRHGFYRGDGAFGQFCIVMPQYDAVVAITSGTGDMQSVMNLVWDRIVPAMGDAALPADPESDAKLSARLSGLSLKKEDGRAMSPMAASVSGRTFTFPENSLHIESLSLMAGGEGASTVLALRISGVDQRVECGHGAWVKGAMSGDMGEADPVAVDGAWSSDDTYSVRVVRYLTPYSTDYDLRFTGGGVILEAVDNVGFAPPPRVRLVGTEKPKPGS